MTPERTKHGGDAASFARSARFKSRSSAKTGLDDPRAVDILTTEHWSLLSTRALGYQEIFGRATIFIGTVSATVISLALLAQATNFGRETLSFVLLLLSVVLFIGVVTFIRTVALNYQDARCVEGLDVLHTAYLQMIPELQPYFFPLADRRSLAHGSPQHLRHLGKSLTTTAGVIAALNSVLAGALASDVSAFFGPDLFRLAASGAVVSIVSAGLHVLYAARFRRRHAP